MEAITFELKQASLEELKNRIKKLDEQILKIQKTKENIYLKIKGYERELGRIEVLKSKKQIH